jgi:uncharacterized repeat protein (TIGR01451 family)
MKKNYTLLFFCLLFSIVSIAETNPPCVIPAPINANICSTPIGTMILDGLPAGSWTLYRSLNGANAVPITGSGTTYTDTGLLNNECYYYTVTDSNGCTSAGMYACIGYLNGLSGTKTETYVDFNNDGITNLGDIIRYNITVTNGTMCPADVDCEFGGAFSSPTATVSNLAVGATDTSAVLDYALTQADINSGSVFNWVALYGLSPNGYSSYAKAYDQNSITLNISDGIRLNAFYDYNNNGIQNSGEPNADSGAFTYQLNNGVVHNAYASTGEFTIYETTPANSYNFGYYAYNTCSGQYYTSTLSYTNVQVAAGSGITTYNFPILQNPCQDTRIILSCGTPRPGFNNVNYIYYDNSGNQTLASGTISFTKDSSLTIASVSEPSAVMTPTGFTYNFTNLLPNQNRYLTVTMAVPPIPTVALGDLVTNSATITIPPADVNPTNNSSTSIMAITNSYDPNDKKENHGGKILYSAFTSNDYLTYTIRFENTGNANAINIRVNDILNAKLDENSIRMVKASHHYVLDRVNNILNWKFDGIDLPPSPSATSTVGHGYIVFQIKPKPGYAVGDIIPNTANIYFDSNPAIVTNTSNTEFVTILNTNDFAFGDFNYYPNPVTNVLTIANNSTIDSVEITSILGQKILGKQINSLEAEIDFSEFSAGIYFVKVVSEGQEKTVKIVKK